MNYVFLVNVRVLISSVLSFLCHQTQLTEKEVVRMEIQALLDQFYTKQNQQMQNGKSNRLSLFILSFCHLLAYQVSDYPWVKLLMLSCVFQ